MKRIQTVLCHVNIMFAGVFIVLWVINIFNPRMQFLASGVTNVALLLFCLSAILLSVVTIVLQRRRANFQCERAQAAARAQQRGGAPRRPPVRR